MREIYSSCKAGGYCPVCINLGINHLTGNTPGHSSEMHHYGTLSYNYRVQTTNSANLGDEIQGFSGLQFVPFIDHFVEQDALNMSDIHDGGNVTVFFNAWWGAKNTNWPPPSNLQPIMISVHIHSTIQSMWAKHIKYLKSKGPIGCRDYSTLEFLTEQSVDAYFSGCLTLLIKKSNNRKSRTNFTYLVDVKDEYVRMLPSKVYSRERLQFTIK